MQNSIRAFIDKEVPFYDVDAYQVVWHGHYPKYFEEARCALLEKIGYDYQTMEKTGYAFPVVDLRVRYVSPIVFKQKVRVLATMKEWEQRLVINYLISDRTTGARLTKGYTTQVAILMPENITQYVSPPDLIRRVEAQLVKPHS